MLGGFSRGSSLVWSYKAVIPAEARLSPSEKGSEHSQMTSVVFPTHSRPPGLLAGLWLCNQDLAGSSACEICTFSALTSQK